MTEKKNAPLAYIYETIIHMLGDNIGYEGIDFETVFFEENNVLKRSMSFINKNHVLLQFNVKWKGRRPYIDNSYNLVLKILNNKILDLIPKRVSTFEIIGSDEPILHI